MQIATPRWIERFRHKPSNFNLAHSELPSYGTVYLNHLIGEFDSLKAGSDKNNCACQLGQTIVDKAGSGHEITWGDTYVLERAVLLMLPDEEVHQRLWCLVQRRGWQLDRVRHLLKSRRATSIPGKH
jgi:hypothetical protein